MIAQHRRHTGRHVDEGNGQEQLPDQVLHRLEGRYRGELVEEAEPQGQGDELDRLLEHRRHEEAQPVAAPARRVGQNPQPQRNRGQGQQDVDKGQAQHHLHHDVEDEEAVDQVEQVEQGQDLGHAHAPGLHGGEKGVEGSPEQVSGGDAQGDGYEAGNGVGHVQDQGAPPERRCGGHQAEHQARHHLPPARLLSAQVLGHDEAEAHPAEDHDEGAGGDGPDDQPSMAHHLVGVGQVCGGAGEDVAHTRLPSPAVGGVLAAGSFNDAAEGPVDSLDHPAGEGSRPASGVEGGQNLVPDAARLVEGYDRVEVPPLTALGGRQHDQQIGPVGVEVGVVVQGRVLEAVLPAVAALLLPALDAVHGAYPVAGVGVADRVEEGFDLPVEDGVGHELAALLALDEVPVGVDQGDGVAARRLGQGEVACGDCHKRRQKQRDCQG